MNFRHPADVIHATSACAGKTSGRFSLLHVNSWCETATTDYPLVRTSFKKGELLDPEFPRHGRIHLATNILQQSRQVAYPLDVDVPAKAFHVQGTTATGGVADLPVSK